MADIQAQSLANEPDRLKVRDRVVHQYQDRNSDRLFLSTITVAEIADGISKASRDGARRKAAALAAASSWRARFAI